MVMSDVLTKNDTSTKAQRKSKKTKQKQPAASGVPVAQKESDTRMQKALLELQTMGFVKV
jgi:hypothetical protein